MDYEETSKREEKRTQRREKKKKPSMKVSGRGMKRFSKPKKTKH